MVQGRQSERGIRETNDRGWGVGEGGDDLKFTGPPGIDRGPCVERCPCAQGSHQRLGEAEQTLVYPPAQGTSKTASVGRYCQDSQEAGLNDSSCSQSNQVPEREEAGEGEKERGEEGREREKKKREREREWIRNRRL